MSAEFQPWPKTPRLFRDIVVTEKIDGTNAAIQIIEGVPGASQDSFSGSAWIGDQFYKVAAQSRKRIITPDSDNFGFARWVGENSQALVEILGTGIHFGEWFGSGIQRSYGLKEKFFALFNTNKWADVDNAGLWGLTVVPVLYQGPFGEDEILDALDKLKINGSQMVKGFDRPEGVVVFHTAAGQIFKVLIENDDISKTEAGLS